MAKLVHHLKQYKVETTEAVYSNPFYVGQDIIACVVTLQPGAIVPEHSHDHHDEIFDVISGKGIFLLDRQEINLTPGMTICVPAQMLHGLKAGNEPWVLRETVHQHVYARQALKRALIKRWQKFKPFFR